MPDPVSWKVMKRGWRVRNAKGNDLGKVSEIRGEPNADIFAGITVKHGLLGKAEYVSSDRVAEILEGEVVFTA